MIKIRGGAAYIGSSVAVASPEATGGGLFPANVLIFLVPLRAPERLLLWSAI